jgi:acetolactate synthase-1/2/3 large subunit
LTLPVLLVLVGWARRIMRTSFRKIRVKLAAMNAYLQEHLSGIKVVQLFGRQDRALGEYNEINIAHRDAYLTAIRADAGLFALVEGIGVASAAVVRALDDVRRRHDPAFVLDAPTFGIWMQRHLPVEREGSYFASAGGAMGWGLPAAFGIQLARPGERVVCVSGDGSFWMVAQDLETAVREHIPVVTLVTNNFAYGNIRDRQRADHGGRHIGVRHGNPDFAAFAEMLGAHGERVERAEDLGPAIERSLASGLPAVIDVVQDAEEGLPRGVRPPPTAP